MKTNQFVQLIVPSLLSGLTSLFLSLGVILAAIYSYRAGSGLVYDYLFGPHSSSALIRNSRSSISAFSNTLFGNPTLNKVLYFGFWMLVGLVTYLIIHYFLVGTQEAMEDIAETTYKNARLREMLTSIFARAAIRLVAFILWLTYGLLFIKTIVPYAVLQAKSGTNNFPSLTSFIHPLLGFLIVLLALHLHVIFIRLIALKTRLFNNSLA